MPGLPPSFATMVLADFGADVIKIDPTGYNSSLPIKATQGERQAYETIKRNKQAVVENA